MLLLERTFEESTYICKGKNVDPKHKVKDANGGTKSSDNLFLVLSHANEEKDIDLGKRLRRLILSQTTMGYVGLVLT